LSFIVLAVVMTALFPGDDTRFIGFLIDFFSMFI
jgi:hypothetical protein